MPLQKNFHRNLLISRYNVQKYVDLCPLAELPSGNFSSKTQSAQFETGRARRAGSTNGRRDENRHEVATNKYEKCETCLAVIVVPDVAIIIIADALSAVRR